MTNLEKAIDDVSAHMVDPQYIFEAANLLVREYGVQKDYPVKLVFEALKAVQS